jgi:hypothetical protein
MVLRSGRWGTPSLIAGFGDIVHKGERNTSDERNGDEDASYYGSVHCNLPTIPFFALGPSKQTRRLQLGSRPRFSVMPTPRVIAAFAGSVHDRQSAADYDYNAPMSAMVH